ncbi:hypothetical protein [Sphingomonas sp. G-3-2-10]|uniref:hypothetical protein n=1 Tax=Sphingomonas sp. G-3-2-10 TaxID=2728838 RepID=UPI00146BA3FB|nr:hypothetical protein [Sphingomonas sp. G-3-2-10]NML05461.1 hypothetical protein [Sphingomonas sp. G-3-2-10]
MKILAMICAVTLCGFALLIGTMMLLGTSLAVTLVSALTGALLGWWLTRFAPRWSGVRVIWVSSAALPLFVWLVALGIDYGHAFYMRWFHPGESFMGGFSIILFLPCCIGILSGLAGAAIAKAWTRRSIA